jgi:hypothetical protein
MIRLFLFSHFKKEFLREGNLSLKTNTNVNNKSRVYSVSGLVVSLCSQFV